MAINQQIDINIYQEPARLLQKLIRYKTVNPPGNEAELINYVAGLLEEAGIETKVVGKSAERLNLIARLQGRGEADPLLMYGHVDVVAADQQEWKYPPFAGEIAEGCVWGRGALDMKGSVVMMLAAILRAKAEGYIPAGDIILNLVSDEEDEGQLGAEYIVEQYPELLKGVRYAIGEIGGFTMHLDQKRFYPIMVSEKQKCSVRAIIKGPGGHGSLPMRGGTMARLADVLKKLDQNRLPVHITPPVREMVAGLASAMSFPANLMLKQLLKPGLTDKILNLLGERGSFFDPILHNTVNATIVRGGNKINVIPGEVFVEFDGRLLPGYQPEDLINELKDLLGDEVEFEITTFIPGPDEADMGLFNLLAEILKEGDGDAIPIPFVVSGCTDARYYARLGIQTYGFTPMLLPEDINFSRLIHGADERIPVDALQFGADSIYQLIKRFK